MVKKKKALPPGVSAPRKSKPKSKITFGKIQRVDPVEERQRRQDARTRRQLRTV
jgi:hypothetical protein